MGPAPRIFTKLLKVPIAILRRLKIRLMIYLDDILLLAPTKEGVIKDRDTAIYLLEGLGFVINYNKSVMTPKKCQEYLGVVVDSQSMTFSIPEGKINSLTALC